ncbi:hypothetical protein STSP2_00626 [Anaerohalosphaera lusitana]|uniref:SGNH hydrolase-type esterase domain-containing protein n=1 Tax=Anaerohalosphaera lusitana TaxID=1936003 RepID=A0A1U9NHS9_9BACT|nr:SGNH/GDSL hydrolase family protein [Anaerohalosphaera lusitana]AQT67479.1 hypothetical protein STSP2_00626 [Anaerohalosphaera lusitana]
MRTIITIPAIIAISFLAGCAATTPTADIPEPNRERIEWCDIWITNANQNDLPRVLMIGDSITRGYFPHVEAQLKETANCARYTTSRDLADPVFYDELTLVLKQYPYAVIHFNNGLHGRPSTEAEYAAAFPRMLETLEKYAPQARLIWATSTPVQPTGAFADFVDRVPARNKIAAEHIAASDKPIAINDLNALITGHPEYFLPDGVHYTNEARKLQAEQVARAITAQLPKHKSAD